MTDYSKMTRAELVERLRRLESGQMSGEHEALIHNLEVHQTELEQQNLQLRETQALLEESRARYADLYDFAPVAYCTFDIHGCIVEINLTWASLLEMDRSSLLGAVSAPFMSDDQRIESLFLATLARTPDDEERAACLDELRACETAEERSRALSDLLWALVNTTEFAFNR